MKRKEDGSMAEKVINMAEKAIENDVAGEAVKSDSADRCSRKAAYSGAGVGLVLFAIFGLLPGSLLGGMLGLKVTGKIFGSPVVVGVLPRVVVGLSMLAGVMIACLVFVAACAFAGWLLGLAMDSFKVGRKAGVEESA